MWVNHSAGRWVALSVARSCAARWAAFFVDNGRSLRALRQTCGSVGSRLSRLLRSGSLRLAAQDVALSRRKQGFESPRERQAITDHFGFPFVSDIFPNLLGVVWATLFFLRPSNLVIASPAK